MMIIDYNDSRFTDLITYVPYGRTAVLSVRKEVRRITWNFDD